MSVLSELEKRAFTKATAEEKKKKQPVVMFGEAKGSSTVMIDGHDIATPCITGVKMQNGDRVRVSIDGHRVVVTENLDKPATDDEYATNAFGKLVRQVNEIRADTGRFGDLFADTADVYVLVSENATVEQLAAADAQIASLEAQDLTAEKLEATDATIALLKADSADVTTLNAGCIVVSSETVQDLAADIATIHQIRSDIANLKLVKADKAQIEDLEAVAAAIEDLDVDELAAQSADIAKLKATSMHADFATFDAAELDAAKVASLFAASGWFENVTVTGDQTITGRLKGVLLDGDTARFQNIYANALKLLGPDGLYHALNFQGMSEALETVYSQVVPSGTEDPSAEGWYERLSSLEYSEVTPSGSEDPSAEGWYERSGEEGSYSYTASADTSVDQEKTYYSASTVYSYAPTEDTSVASGTTYYAASQRIADAGTRAFAETYGEALDNGLHGSHIIAESITATQLDATSVRAALLEVLNLTVGYSGATHIDMSGDRMSFKKGTQEVAYIDVDENGDSTFYMTRSIVVKTLRFGKWEFRQRANSNMQIKWMGA